MKTSEKTSYYTAIFIICIACSILALLTLKSLNKYPSEIAVKNSISLYINNYYNKNNNQDLKSNFPNKTFPFEIEFLNDVNNNRFDLSFNQKNKKLVLKNYNLLSTNSKSIINDILSPISLHENISDNYNASLINTLDKIAVYSQINFYIIVNTQEDLSYYEKYLNIFNDYRNKYTPNNSNISTTIKFIYYDDLEELVSQNGIIIYDELKRLNSYSFFVENLDKNKLGIFLVNTKKEANIKFNEDINSIIYPINFEKDLSAELINKIININNLGNYFNLGDLKDDLFNEKILYEFVKFFNDDYIQFHLKSLITLKNLDKISKIFPLYETIKTFFKAKPKIDEIHNTLILFMNHRKFGYNTDLLNKLYMDTVFLLESSELVTFELYFSFEFKIGQFLPLMMPVIYGMTKLFKSKFR